MQLILLERIEKLGSMGDVVTVKDGFARNYLLPQGKALRATKANMEYFEKQREELEKKNADARAIAETQSGKMDGAKLVLIRQAGEAGQLYGSVATRDIAEVLNEMFDAAVSRNQVQLDRPIKMIGLHDVTIRLHPEVSVTVIANVARTEEEAELQAAGEVLVGNAAEREEAREAAEEMLAEINAAQAEEGEEAEEAGEAGEGEEPAGEDEEAGDADEK